MAKYYESFIELSPGYESVVDVGSEVRLKDFWTRYIVNDDMVKAVDLLTKSIRQEEDEHVRHFWIKGAYGTGKTYSAIVLKHLLEDDYDKIEKFLAGNPLFSNVRDKFLSKRKKGKYYVKFRSGECKQLNTSNKLLFAIEQSVRDILAENNMSYTGRNSLIESVVQKTNEFHLTLKEYFNAGLFQEYWGTHDTFDSFLNKVNDRDIVACSAAQEILQHNNIGLATDLDTFKKWMIDVYKGNAELSKTGIFIIWDEFTDYIRHNDIDIIQQLSLFSKEIPFFIIYIMHSYPGLNVSLEEKNLEKAEGRFHKIDISLNEKTTYKLIGESIITKPGMENIWKDTCENLSNSIMGKLHLFLSDPGEDMGVDDLKKIFPIHPMTVNLVSKVAGLAASNRSIFNFLKSDESDGFKCYIHNNGPDDWKWVTIDYLWDYYFINDGSSLKEQTLEAENCIKHYFKVAGQISDNTALRVFKGAMLLLATVGSGHALKITKHKKGIRATQNTLIDCFFGQVNSEEISAYLDSFANKLKILVLAGDKDDFRIDLPYTTGGDDLDAEIQREKQQHPISKLFEAHETFGSLIKKQFIPEDKAINKRLEIETCWGTSQQINAKMSHLIEYLDINTYKFGLLIIIASSNEEIEKSNKIVSEILADNANPRLFACVIKTPFTSELSDTWYSHKAHATLSIKSNKSVNAEAYKSRANDVIGEWVSISLGQEILLAYMNAAGSSIYTSKGVISQIEKLVIKVFPYAPESIMKKVTLYKSGSKFSAYYGLQRVTSENKNTSDEMQKNFGTQYQDIVDTLIDAKVWDINSLDTLIMSGGTTQALSIAKLASFVNDQLSSGSVLLSDFWDCLQREFGYYDTLICSYLLGFVFKFYLGQYTWFDGSNPHRLDANTASIMIASICSGKTAGMKLSSESDVEKYFKLNSKKIFHLSDDESADIEETRKFIRARITKTGYPLWTLHYIDDAKYAGAKEDASNIIRHYSDFLLNQGDQNAAIEDSVNIIKANASVLVPMLSEMCVDKSTLQSGMYNFIHSKSADLIECSENFQLAFSDIYQMLKEAMQEEIWQWREEDVCSKLIGLSQDVRLIGYANMTTQSHVKTTEKVKEMFTNVLKFLSIPGCVYEQSKYQWCSAIKVMYLISQNQWQITSSEEKEIWLNIIKNNIQEAIIGVNKPIEVLREYLIKIGEVELSEFELEQILDSLPKESYQQLESSFKNNIKKQIFEFDYIKKCKLLTEVWVDKTSTKSTDEWHSKYDVPLDWVMPELVEWFGVLRSIEHGDRITIGKIEAATSQLIDTNCTKLIDKHEIDIAFLENIASEKHINILLSHVDALKDYLKKKIESNPQVWITKQVTIRKEVEKYILQNLSSEITKKAKEKLSNISDIKMREVFNELLESSTEASVYIANTKLG